MNEIQWTKKATKQWLKLQLSDRQRIFDSIETLKSWPDCRNVKALVNRQGYRLKVGRYRVLFTADLKIIRIEEVKKRDERTY